MSNRKMSATSLPMSRVAKIMQSAAGVSHVNHDVIALTTKATELFLMDLARRAYDLRQGQERSSTLEYEDICELIHQDVRYDFLRDTTPPKIKFSEALKLVKENERKKGIVASPEVEESASMNADDDAEE